MSSLPARNQRVLKLIGIVFCVVSIITILMSTGNAANSTSNISSGENLSLNSEIKAIPVVDQTNPNQNLYFNNLNSPEKEVIELQTQLKKRGYYPGALDGVYGAETEEAVYNFQVSMGLQPTGTADPQTWKSLQQNGSSGVAVPASLTSPPPTTTSLSPDLQAIVDRGELIVAVLGVDSVPFFSPDKQGNLTGLDIKIAQDLSTALGVGLKIDRQAKTFNDVVDLVNSRQADIGISKLSQTLARAKKVSFSRPYLTLRQGLLINRLQLAKAAEGKDIVDFLKTFQGNIGVIKGSSYVGFTKEKFPKAKINEFTTWEDVIEAAIKGNVLAAYRDELEVKKIILNQPNIALNFKTVALSDSYDPIAIAVPWSSHHLLEFVNLYLDLNKINYTVDSLIDEYSDAFGQPNHSNKPKS